MDDVPPGRYRLNRTLHAPRTFALLASFERPIIVPPSAETGDAPPVALAPIALHPEPRQGRK